VSFFNRFFSHFSANQSERSLYAESVSEGVELKV
jgi:hypothetical protein